MNVYVTGMLEMYVLLVSPLRLLFLEPRGYSW